MVSLAIRILVNISISLLTWPFQFYWPEWKKQVDQLGMNNVKTWGTWYHLLLVDEKYIELLQKQGSSISWFTDLQPRLKRYQERETKLKSSIRSWHYLGVIAFVFFILVGQPALEEFLTRILPLFFWQDAIQTHPIKFILITSLIFALLHNVCDLKTWNRTTHVMVFCSTLSAGIWISLYMTCFGSSLTINQMLSQLTTIHALSNMFSWILLMSKLFQFQTEPMEKLRLTFIKWCQKSKWINQFVWGSNARLLHPTLWIDEVRFWYTLFWIKNLDADHENGSLAVQTFCALDENDLDKFLN